MADEKRQVYVYNEDADAAKEIARRLGETQADVIRRAMQVTYSELLAKLERQDSDIDEYISGLEGKATAA